MAEWHLGRVILGLDTPPRAECPVCEGTGFRGPQRWWGRSTCVLCVPPANENATPDSPAQVTTPGSDGLAS